jgi:choline dehydrogenase
VPALHPFASEYEPITWDFFVEHHSDLEQQKKDSKMTYQLPDGSYYIGLEPPENATPLGILYPRTGTLGGCAEHNAMIMIYPHETDWQYIQEITGDNSWSPANMRTYFQKLERCQYLPNSVVGHGFTGWLPTAVTNPVLIVEDRKVLSLVIAAVRIKSPSYLQRICQLTHILGYDYGPWPPWKTHQYCDWAGRGVIVRHQ